MSQRNQKLEAAGYSLDRTTKPGAIYEPLVRDGTTLYASGAVPFDGDQLTSRGKVPSQVSMEAATQAVALCAANILRLVAREYGSLDAIDRILRLTGYVNSDPNFTDQHLVVNGASQLLIDVLGEAGRHARSAVGMAQLPLGCSVELEMILRIKDQ